MEEFQKDQMGEQTGKTEENSGEMEFPIDQPEQTVKKPSVNISLLAKWINVLFWLVIVVNIASLFTSENVTNAVPPLALAGQIISIAAEAIYGIILIPVTDGTEFLLAIPVVIVTIVVDMLGEYYEFMGHTDVLCDVDTVLSDKWFNLWKWYLGTFLCIIGGTVLAVMIPLIGLLVVLAATVGTLIVNVLKIVYLYKTAKAFRTFPQ